MLTAERTREPKTVKGCGVSALDITVLAGGPGMEREVSLNSGRAVFEALRRLGHKVELADISPDNMSALERAADCVFIALHGEFGEDGTLQGELERRGIVYSGSNAVSSRTAMDKVAAKRCFRGVGIPTPDFVVIDTTDVSEWPAWNAYPAFVKPVSSGSSVDTFPVSDRAELERLVGRLVFRYGRALVETRITGPELTVGILGDLALPVCEIRTRRDFYDYAAKYVDDDTQYLFDLDLPSSLLDRVRTMSLAAHRSLGCSVFSRVDWMIDGETGEAYLLEVNTIPGFTSHSLLPKSAARVGIDFDMLCQRIIELSTMGDG